VKLVDSKIPGLSNFFEILFTEEFEQSSFRDMFLLVQKTLGFFLFIAALWIEFHGILCVACLVRIEMAGLRKRRRGEGIK